MTRPAKILHVPRVHDSLVLLYSTAGLESNQDLKFRLGIQSISLQTNVKSFFCISYNQIFPLEIRQHYNLFHSLRDLQMS